MITKIYLDMDGVLTNFEDRYTRKFGMTPKESRDQKEFSPNWTSFVTDAEFATLDWFPGGQKLIRFVKSLGVPVEILSSSGGKKFHAEVTSQKITWLCNNGIPFTANIVPGRRLKRDYATPTTILIDDTPDVIESFNAAGGIGILHSDVEETIREIKLHFPAPAYSE